MSVLKTISSLLKRRERHYYCTAIVPAAGSSSRMGGPDKLFMEIDGVPLLARTLMALNSSAYIDEIVVAAREEDALPVYGICTAYRITKMKTICPGGDTRAHSVLNALLEASPGTELFAVHDGARPLLSQQLIERTVRAAAVYKAAAPALPLTDTVKRAQGGMVEATLERGALTAVQTPQVFDAGLLKGALTKALREGAPITDDCEAIERMGMSVKLVGGEARNIKVTTPDDLSLAGFYLGEVR